MKNKKVRNLLILLAVTVIFTLIVCLVDRQPIGPNSTVVGCAKLNGWFRDVVGYKKICYFLSQAFGYLALLVCVFFGGVGLLQLITKKSLKKVDKSIILLGFLYIVTIILYVVFDKIHLNYRPIIMEGETIPESSFPSSHAMLAIVVYCSAPTVLKRYFSDSGTVKGLYYGFYGLAIATVITRLLSGVHWLTDIIAGVLISTTILYAFFIALDEVKKRFRTNK